MGWEATGDPWTGGSPDRTPACPGPRGFEHGGAWAEAVPSAALSSALETAAGPDDLYEGAQTDALVGSPGSGPRSSRGRRRASSPRCAR